MSWTDKDIDELYKDTSSNLSFEYKNEYWNEVEALLPKKKKRDFVWFLTAFGSAGVLVMGFFYSNLQTGTMHTSEALWKAEVNPALPQNEVSKKYPVEQDAFNSNGMLAGILASSNIPETLKGAHGTYNLPTNWYEGLNLDLQFMNNWSMPSYGNDMGYYSNPAHDDALREKFLLKEGLEEDANESFGLSTRPLVSSIDKSLAPNILVKEEVLPSAISLYVEANAGISQSLITPSNELFQRYGGGIGVQLTNQKWTATFGVNGYVSHHTDIIMSREAKRYAFGSEIITRNLDYRRLYYMEGVFAISRNFGRHALTVGLRPSLLISSKVEYTIYDEALQLRESKELNRYTEGMHLFGLKPTIGYAYRVSPNWNIGVNVGVQTLTSFKEEFIMKDNNRFPIDGQVYIRRNLRLRK